MPQINLITYINAPIKRCFDLSRSIDLHKISTASSQEETIAGVTSGLIKLGETVTWRAKHFGVWVTLTSGILKMQVNESFTDEMVKGPFKSMEHHHYFEVVDGKTVMKDVFNFSSPYGWIGKLLDEFILSAYFKKLLQSRNELIKFYAEGESWKELPGFNF